MQPVATVIGNCTWKKEATWFPHTFFFFLFLLTVERMRAESAQAAAKMLEEMQIKNQQMMEQKEKSYQEHVKQLTEKMERDRAQLLEEQERTLALKLQVFNCNTVWFLLFCFPSWSQMWPSSELEAQKKDLACLLVLFNPYLSA